MYLYTGQDDVTKSIKNALFEGKSTKEMLSQMFRGKLFGFPES